MKNTLCLLLTALLIAVTFTPNSLAQTLQDDPQQGDFSDGVQTPRDMEFSPDSVQLAVAGYSGVSLYDVQTGDQPVKFRGQTSPASGIAFSPDGKILVCAIASETRLLDVKTGRPLGVIKADRGSSSDLCVAFSPDGRMIASGGNMDCALRVFDADTGKRIFTLSDHMGQIWTKTVAFSPDSRTIATDNWDNTVRLWDAQTGKHLRTIEGFPFSARSMSFSPDGKMIATTGFRGVKLWDVNTGQHIRTLADTIANASGSMIYSVSFSPDGRTITGINLHGCIRLWNANTGQHTRTFRTGKSGIGTTGLVAFSPDGKTIAASCNGDVDLWDAKTGQLLQTLIRVDGKKTSIVKNHFVAMKYSPDGIRLACAGSYGILLYDVQMRDKNVQKGGKPVKLAGHTGRGWRVVFSPDSKILASITTYGTLRLLDTNTGQLLRAIRGGPETLVSSVAFSPDSKIIAGGMTNYTCGLFDANTGKRLRTLSGHTSIIRYIAFSPDGRTIASVGSEGTLRLWDVDSEMILHTFKGHGYYHVHDVAFSPDGRTIVAPSARFDEGISLWDVNTGQSLRTLAGTHPKGSAGWLHNVAFSPDGEMIVGANPLGLYLWDVDTGKLLRTFIRRRTGYGPCVVEFSADGKTIAACGPNEVDVWDVNTGKLLRKLKMPD